MVRIGWSPTSENDGQKWFNGSISGISVYGSALTAAQVQSLYQGNSGGILPTATPLSIAAASMLDLDGVNQQVASLSDYTAGNGGSLINSNTGLAAVLTVSPSSGSTTFSGVIQGGGSLGTLSLAMSGSGTQVLAGANTYTGATTVSFGTLQVGITNALPTATALTFANSAGAVLNLNRNSQTVGSLAGGGASGGNVALGGGTLTVGNASSTSYSGNINGNGVLTKQGTGMLTLTAVQGYSGATIISGGTLQLGVAAGLAHNWSFNNNLADSVGGVSAILYGNATLSSSSVTITGNGSSHINYVALGSGSNLLPTTNSPATIELWATENQVENWSRVFDFGSTAGGVSNLMWSWTNGTGNPGAIWAGAGSNQNAYAYTNTGTEYHIALVLTPNGSSTNLNWYQMNLAGTVLNSGSATSAWNISQLTQTNMWLGRSEYGDNDANASYEGVRIWDTALTQAQLSAASVAGPNGLSGNFLPTATPLTVAANATLDLGGGPQQVASLSDYTPGSGGSLINSNTGFASILTLSPTSGSSTFSGQIRGGGALGTLSLVMSGSGTQVLAGSSSYTGGTTVSGGTLQLGAANALPTATALSFANSAGAVLNLNGNNQTVGSLAGGGPSGGNVALGGGTLTIGNAASTSYSGVIGGNGALIKQGAGMLTLNGVQGYSGPTIVSGGTLQLQSLWTAAPLAYTFASGTAANIGTLSVSTSTSGSPTFSANGGPKPGLGSVTLNGSQYIEIDPTSGSLPNLGGTSGNSYTIGMWIKTSVSGGEFLYKGGASWAGNDEAFFLTSGVGTGTGGTGTHVGGVQYGGGWVGGNTNVVNGNWNYISIVRSGGTSTMYVNGVADGTSTSMGNAENGTQMIRIGWTNDGGDGPVNFNGSISGVSVYGSA